MSQVKTLIITGYGTNGEQECAYAAQEGGSQQTTIAYFSDLVAGKIAMHDYNFLIFPGGFLDGDDLGAAHTAAHRWRWTQTKDGQSVLEALGNFFKAGNLILGIGNGFQLLVRLGLLPALNQAYFEPQVSLAHNQSAKFEDRWVTLKVNTQSPSIFTKGLDYLYLPVRHGLGQLIPRQEQVLADLEEQNLIALQYVHPQTLEPTLDYPANPNGSPLAIAGLSDPTGRILGLMPHPEAYTDVTNHPRWTRGDSAPLGTILFQKGVEYLQGR